MPSLAVVARRIKDKARIIAAAALECAPDDLAWEHGRWYVKGDPEKGKTIRNDRLCAVPVTVWLLLQQRTAIVFFLFVLAGLSDAIDGWLARRRGPSALGAVLDPVADKALLVTMYVTLAAVNLGLRKNWILSIGWSVCSSQATKDPMTTAARAKAPRMRPLPHP